MIGKAWKYSLTKAGATLPEAAVRQLQAAVNYLKLGRWAKNRGYNFYRVGTREAVWDVLIARIDGRKLLYLEFGVAQGYSIRYWATHVSQPDAVFHGFDSFEGLPADGGPWKKGQFGTGGRIPSLADPRVRFFKGWFDKVLPDYEIPPHDVLVINLDADLYSSTIYVLRRLRSHIRKGTLIYFDELNHVEHEPRAFDEFVAESEMQFAPVCADRTMAYAAFECLGGQKE